MLHLLFLPDDRLARWQRGIGAYLEVSTQCGSQSLVVPGLRCPNSHSVAPGGKASFADMSGRLPRSRAMYADRRRWAWVLVIGGLMATVGQRLTRGRCMAAPSADPVKEARTAGD